MVSLVGLAFASKGRLTAAESMLVHLVARGLSNEQLASARGASRSTIANQLTHAYRKLGVRGRRELCALIGRECVPLPPPKFLSRREREVLALADFGQSNKFIAHSLGLSVSTISTMLTRARRKLELCGARAQALELQPVLGGFRGQSTRNSVPRSGLDVTSKLPACARTLRSTT